MVSRPRPVTFARVRQPGRALGHDHRATKAMAKAAVTMAKVDLWHARLALKTLRKDQREAIAEATEN